MPYHDSTYTGDGKCTVCGDTITDGVYNKMLDDGESFECKRCLKFKEKLSVDAWEYIQDCIEISIDNALEKLSISMRRR